MNVPSYLKPGYWLDLACRGFVAFLGTALFLALCATAPFGPILLLGAASFVAFKVRKALPERRPRRERSSGGAERTPVLPGQGVQP